MAEPIIWKDITTAFKGRMIIGSYAVPYLANFIAGQTSP